MTDQGGELGGRYANYFAIGFNAVEFVLDFGQFFSGSEAPRIHTRIITNPIYAKRLWTTLLDSLQQYEQSFGVIRDEDS